LLRFMGEIGNAMHFWQVAMRPGKPLAFGAIEGIPCLACRAIPYPRWFL